MTENQNTLKEVCSILQICSGNIEHFIAIIEDENRSKNNTWFIVLLSFVIRLNTLWGTFIWDDRAAVVQNADVKPGTTIFDIFQHDFWGQNISAVDSHKSYRPLTTITYRLNWTLHRFYCTC